MCIGTPLNVTFWLRVTQSGLLFFLFLVVLFGNNPVQAQSNITRVEYYIDTDPGYGAGTPLTISPSKQLNDLSVSINPNSLANGVHELVVRAKNANEVWGLNQRWLFFKPYTSSDSPVKVSNITYAEYYLDTDPGFEKATPLALSPATDLSNLLININPTGLTSGVHQLNFRAKNANGAWSLTQRWLFLKPFTNTDKPNPAGNITRVEWYLDTDPGFGNGKQVNSTSATDLSNVLININPEDLSSGVHQLNVRAKDASEKWSLAQRWLFLKPFTNTDKPTPAGDITRVEWYLDNDPGFGSGKQVNITPATDISNVLININPEELTNGVHQLNVRAKDANEKWSLTQRWLLLKPYPKSVDPAPLAKISYLEYYIGKDPGLEKGTPIPTMQSTDIQDLNIPVDISALEIGDYTVFVRAKDTNGKWSLTNSWDFKVADVKLAISIGEVKNSFCAGNTLAIPFTIKGLYGNSNVFTAQLSNSIGDFKTFTNIGTLTSTKAGTINATIPVHIPAGIGYRVRIVASSPADTSGMNSKPITIGRPPEQYFTITGKTNTCLGTETYAVSEVEIGNVKYRWQLSGGGTIDTTGAKSSAKITWTKPGVYTLKFTPANACGIGSERTLQVAVFSTKPTLTPTITANNRSLQASAANTANGVASYQWYKDGVAIPNAVDASYYAGEDGSYTVQYTNACGAGPISKAVNIPVIEVPKTPDLVVQNVSSSKTVLAPNEEVTVTWQVGNIGEKPSTVDWTEQLYMQSPDGQNRTLLKQLEFANSKILSIGQTLARSEKFKIPAQFNIGNKGVFVVELVPGAAVQEGPGGNTNNTGVQTTPWTVKKLLTLELTTAQLTEGSSEKITAIVNRTGSLTSPLTVNIQLSQSGRFSFPATVTIPAGQAGSSFTIAAPDNKNLEGTLAAVLKITAPDFPEAKANITVLDNDKPSLTITQLPAKATEGQTITFKVATNLAPTQALEVFLTSDQPKRFAVAPEITIPSGSLSREVTVKLEQDSIPEVDAEVSITAGAGNHNSATATIQIKDDDLPGLELVIQTNLVAEAAGLYATKATLRRKANSSPVAFTANISANVLNSLLLPTSISLAAGENEKTFDIGVVDNSQAEGDKKVTITAAMFVASCGCSAPPASSGAVSATLTVTDNDGAALQVSADPLTLPEGKVNAGLLRITRNTATTTALTVNVTSSNTQEATVPATATIPAGKVFVEVPITTIKDATADGNQQVYFQAKATGFSTGSAWVMVSDLNKPDLQISSVVLPEKSLQAMAVFNYQFSVKNTGSVTAPTGAVVRGYLSQDDLIDDQDTLIIEDITKEPIPAGQTITIPNAIPAPNLPGTYKLLLWVNPEASLTELLLTNNTSKPVNLNIKPDYTVTAQVNAAYFLKNTTIPVTGSAVQSDGKPAMNEKVEVYVITQGLRRTIIATTNGTGNYTAEFTPLANEAGHYTVGASFPGMKATKEQDAFDILGVQINEGKIPQFKVVLNDTLRGAVVIKNLSTIRLTNFTLQPVTLPNGAKMLFNTLPTLPGNKSGNLSYKIVGSVLSPGANFEVASLQAVAQEGKIQKNDIFTFARHRKLTW
ncbi:CARDB domain-containing protein [Adhaeribacter pallidiroseus]|uniref:PKD domain-containing protein n=1 Tax=Adhaeribacter pallidiroseus TaxID=2072847 RepID=A0A369QG36_9BACT|nr:CARDB domain-containing protein [Adhaeribacter pallidiroseus]RDC62515.1 hypothetical protein AHMF7616_01109 [Adhaeribacter pallidiroseus]